MHSVVLSVHSFITLLHIIGTITYEKHILMLLNKYKYMIYIIHCILNLSRIIITSFQLFLTARLRISTHLNTINILFYLDMMLQIYNLTILFLIWKWSIWKERIFSTSENCCLNDIYWSLTIVIFSQRKNCLQRTIDYIYNIHREFRHI